MIPRRDFLLAAAGASSLVNAASADAKSPASNPPAKDSLTFVLVHGTWHGGWVWRDVADRLRGLGHRVFTPTCTGCGERIHLTGPEVGLETHITDITNVIEFEELQDVILIGHSFSGITITGVADRLRDRIRRIVFFDAIVPHGGRLSAISSDPKTGELPAWWRKREKKFVDGYQMNMWEDYPIEMLVPPDRKEIVAQLRRRITTHPAKQWTDKLNLVNGGWEGMPRSFIHCVGQKYQMTGGDMMAAARGPGWDFIELDIPRNGMLTDPILVADALQRIV